MQRAVPDPPAEGDVVGARVRQWHMSGSASSVGFARFPHREETEVDVSNATLQATHRCEASVPLHAPLQL